MKNLKPLDFIIFIFLIAFSIFLIKNTKSVSGDIVHIHSENADYAYPLKKDAVYKIPGPLGYTLVQVKNKKVRIIDSPCPSKSCLKQGFHSPIVCLPNKVIVTIENYGDFDAVSE
ncbi:MAG: NusG domain II-containing protein [Treponema sp.]|nr:NusG domain II-containing protein [Treponema sp.]